MKNKYIVSALLLTLMLTASVTGCCQGIRLLSEAEAQRVQTDTNAWLAYWDVADGRRALKNIGGRLRQLSYFAAFFDNEGRLIYPAELKELRAEHSREGKYQEYITIVNDVNTAEEAYDLKSQAVLEKHLLTPEARAKHIQELIAFTKKNNFEGLEIDYENFWTNEGLAQAFPKFIEELYGETKKNNLGLRVVLEPKVPFSRIKFTEGPKYIVMLYNLYGTHGGPGPKANKKFIINTLAKMQSLPGPKAVALSTGGCLWDHREKGQFITEAQAQELQRKYLITPKRDKDSGVLNFKFRQGTKVSEVWYADSETLAGWTLWAKQAGAADISLWRLGGNENLKKYFAELNK